MGFAFGSENTRARLRVFVHYFPVYCEELLGKLTQGSLSILFSTWLAFLIFVSIGAVLKQYGETRRFISQ